MLGKLTFLAGAGVGYVLGARAGRERYEQIMQQVRGVKQRPEVQDALSTVKQQATEVASTAADTAKQKAGAATDAAKSKVGSDSGSSSSGAAAGATTAGIAEPTVVVSDPLAGDPLVDPLTEPVVDPLPGSTGTSTGTSGLGSGSAPAPVVPPTGTSGTSNL